MASNDNSATIEKIVQSFMAKGDVRDANGQVIDPNKVSQTLNQFFGVSQRLQAQKTGFAGNTDAYNKLLDQQKGVATGLLDQLNSWGVDTSQLKGEFQNLGSLGLNLTVPSGGSGGNSSATTTYGSPPPPATLIPGTNIDANSDRGQIEQEASRETPQITNAVNQAADLRTQGISKLGDILTKQNQAQFNYDLPNIKEQLQGSGLYSSDSALANAVARESGLLGANTASTLSQAGLGNIDLQAQGILGANQNAIGLQQGGLQRKFSLADYEKQAQLARDIGAASVPQSPGFSIGGALGGGAAAGTAGAGLMATNPALYAGLVGAGAVAGGSKNSGTYICTAMRKARVLSKKQVKKIHDHLFPVFGKRIPDILAYAFFGPQLVATATSKGTNWNRWKELFFDRVMNEKEPEKAFDLYHEAFVTMWREVV